MNVENGSVIAGVLGMIVSQAAAAWKEERRYKRNSEERKEADRKATEAREEAERQASDERRRVMRRLRSLRPDRHCQARGCPLVTLPPPPTPAETTGGPRLAMRQSA